MQHHPLGGRVMDSQQLGERFGRLEAGQDGLDRRMVEMQTANEKDHGEVKDLLTEIRDEVAKKASKEEVEKVAERTDRLESRIDKISAVVAAAVVVVPLAIGLLQLVTGGGL